MVSPEETPPRTWLGRALLDSGSFRLGEGINGEGGVSSARPLSCRGSEVSQSVKTAPPTGLYYEVLVLRRVLNVKYDPAALGTSPSSPIKMSYV